MASVSGDHALTRATGGSFVAAHTGNLASPCGRPRPLSRPQHLAALAGVQSKIDRDWSSDVIETVGVLGIIRDDSGKLVMASDLIQMDALDSVFDPLRDFAKDSVVNRKEFTKVPSSDSSLLTNSGQTKMLLLRTCDSFNFQRLILYSKLISKSESKCSTVGIQGIAWAFGGMIFALVYCTASISGGYINPAVTFGLFLARKLSLTRAVFYMVMQCLGAICGAGLVKGFDKTLYQTKGGGAIVVNLGYTKGSGLGAEIVGTFVLVYTKGSGLGAEIVGTFVLVYIVFSATDAKRSARDSHVPLLAPLPIGFAVFLVHLATIPITGFSAAASYWPAFAFHLYTNTGLQNADYSDQPCAVVHCYISENRFF
uniref:Uncharacterized protein LOC104246785 n=1 Tax=Nicotiana sylvestris TaxID=4096 RepID=A0A1U7YA27_NICSY|nr:PREDICTED: uncharacterized protein LOC104246785 [Nicotiana sylvestris]